MLELLQYGFIVRGLEAGLIIGLVAPLIGIFLVLRRYSLIADTLSHVSLAGVAIGLLAGVNPIFTAVGATVISSLAIEKLRLSKRIYGETALSIFLSGSLAVAIVIISLAHGFNTNLFSYLFGSIVTVRSIDVLTIGILGLVVIFLVLAFYKELLFVSFDEELARVSGVSTGFINTIFIVLAAVTIALSIPIVGVLLISALIVIPVVSALQFRMGFWRTTGLAVIFSVLSVLVGIVVSYYLNLSSGGTIVIVNIGILLLALSSRLRR